MALSVLVHAAVLGPALSLRSQIDLPEPQPEPVLVTLETPPRLEPPPPPEAPVTPEPDPAPAPAAKAPPAPAAAKPASRPAAPPPLRLRQPRNPPPSAPLPAAEPVPEPPGITLLDAGQIAGAATAGPRGGGGGGGPGGAGAGGDGSGSGGGRCDMVRRLQDALSDDAEIRASVLAAHRALAANGRALLVWDGDWLQSRGEAGKGLAGLRQAIAVEVAFSPPACKEQAMRGLAVIALPDGPRIAVGRGAWRWRDLTGAR